MLTHCSAARQRELEQAKAELEAALAELKAQEDAYNAKTEELKQKSEGGGVAALRAKSMFLCQCISCLSLFYLLLFEMNFSRRTCSAPWRRSPSIASSQDNTGSCCQESRQVGAVELF